MSVLQEVFTKVTQVERPVDVFDIDWTLISTQKRNFAILCDFVNQLSVPSPLCDTVRGLSHHRLRWNPIQDLRSLGFTDETLLAKFRTFWAHRFFNNDYLHHDEPLPGAVEFVQVLRERGATIFYLTARHAEKMGQGTLASLKACGFPIDAPDCILRLKSEESLRDVEFKQQAAREACALGEVVAAFENEPANANIFCDVFPAAHVFLLDTVHSPEPPPLRERVRRIKNYL